jgi:uncharacterized membrane protein YccC
MGLEYGPSARQSRNTVTVATWQSRLRRAWRRLRARGLRRYLVLERTLLRQVVKTALAATVSWQLADVVLDSPIPALAAMAAIITVQVTVKQTVARGIQQTIGVAVGVGAALLVVGVLGVHAWSVGLVILGALLIGQLLRLGPQANQVAISALLVVSLGSGYGAARIYDTLLGALVGVVVNMLLAPPTHVAAAGAALRELGEDLGLLLAEIGDGLQGRWDYRTTLGWLERARDLDADRAGVREAVERGAESIHYNPRARSEAEAQARLAEGYAALEHATTQTRGIARSLADLRRDGAEPDERVRRALAAYGDLLRTVGSAVAAFGRLQAEDDGDRGGRHELVRTLAAAGANRDQVAGLLPSTQPAETGHDAGQPVAARTVAAMLVDAERLMREVDPELGAHTAAVPAAAKPGPARG